MAPKTPQGNKSPRAPSAGGPVPLTGIPAPGSGLQRRSFMPTPTSTTKSYQSMSSDQIAEAIAVNSPGLIDPNRKRDSVESDTSLSGPSHHRQSPVPTSFSPGHSSNGNPPTGLASPLSYRSLQSRRTSSRQDTEGSLPTPTGQPGLRAPGTSTSAIPPLTTTHLQSSASSTPSPAADSPSAPRTMRMSGLGMGLPAPTSTSTSASATRLVKQPQFQRPPSMGSSSGVTLAKSIPQQGTNGAGLASVQEASRVQGLGHVHASLEGIELGDRVLVDSMGLSGYLRFAGPVEFKTGVWVGIELDTPIGKNDGSVAGVSYFNCRPNCGIFVLASKIVKTELLIPAATPAPVTTGIRPPSSQGDAQASPVDHAAQAASRISAGSRASKYIGMTASQLKQRNNMPQPTLTRRTSQQQLQQPQQLQPLQPIQPPQQPQQHSIPSVQTPAALSIGNAVPAPSGIRSGLGSRLSQPGSKLSLMSSKIGSQARTAPPSTAPPAVPSATTPPATPSVIHTPITPLTPLTPLVPLASPTSATSSMSPAGSRPRVSRRLSSRASNHSDSNSSSNLLDQATLIQMAESPQGDMALRYQQLQLEFEVAIAEKNMLKTEVNQTKNQLEVNRLLEKRDLSYEERVFLSKSLGRGGIDERLGEELEEVHAKLEELHATKAEWEKERVAKDQEIKAITEKMTQAWLDSARSQKEKTALLEEKSELEQRLKELEEGGPVRSETGSGPASEEHQELIESLKDDIQDSEEKIAALEAKLRELTNQAIDDEDKMRAIEDAMATEQVRHAQQQALLEQERDDLQMRLEDAELVLKVSTDALQAKLEIALRDAGQSDEQLLEVQARLDHEAELRRQKESDAEAKLKSVETELQESQTLLAKSEKQVKTFEEKIKDHQSSIAKREQEISDLKREIEDLANMAQSDETDKMRKVWENEKKRLEDAVFEDATIIAGLRADIETLEEYDAECRVKINELETTVTALTKSNSELESEVTRLKTLSAVEQGKFGQERSELQAKVDEAEKALETHSTETQAKIEGLEAIAQSVDSWKGQCEALQLEMSQRTAKAEDIGLELAEVQAERDAFKLEAETAQRELVDKAKQLEGLEKLQLEVKTAQDDKLLLASKISELETALSEAKTATAPVATSTEPDSKRMELEEEVANLKQMVQDLTKENVTVGAENKKLMLEHDNLMEAHKLVENECLKLMDEVERLHSESLAAPVIGEAAKHDADLMENAELKAATSEKDNTESQASQSQSVIRLEGLLKEKQALLDRLTQGHATEMRELRKRYVDLDRSKAEEVAQLNKELTDLESLIESKIFREADLEEDVHRKQKQIDQLEREISDFRSNSSNGSNGYLSPNRAQTGYRPAPPQQRVPVPMDVPPSVQINDEGVPLFCEICEVEGHDIVSCTATFGSASPAPSLSSTPVPSDVHEDRPYCENCEEYDDHYTDECPNESLTY